MVQQASATRKSWEPSAARRAWLERSAITSVSVAKRLEAVLSAVRASGYTVQLMSPEMARAIHVIGVLREDSFSVAMRKVVDRLLAEVVTQTHLPGERRAAGSRSTSRCIRSKSCRRRGSSASPRC